MREIKFRGKRIDNGEWVQGYYLFNPFFNRAEIFSFDNERSYVYEVDPATVGQYTGLKDKNGKEICEGDIVTFNNNNFKVVYKQDRYYIGWVATDEGENCYIHIWYDDIEVLGNIYDNPEMLRQWKGH